MTSTRPNICYAVTLLSQFMAKPTKAHLSMAEHVLRYIKGTMNYGLKFKKSTDNLELVGFSDWVLKTEGVFMYIVFNCLVMDLFES